MGVVDELLGDGLGVGVGNGLQSCQSLLLFSHKLCCVFQIQLNPTDGVGVLVGVGVGLAPPPLGDGVGVNA